MHPEKQTIEVFFSDGSTRRNSKIDTATDYIYSESGGQFTVEIFYTVRSWGVDIDSLLTDHIKSLRIIETGWKPFLYNRAGFLGLIFGSMFFILCIIGEYFVLVEFSEKQFAIASEIAEGIEGPSASEALNFVIQRTASGEWAQFILALVVFFFLAIFFSIFFGVFVGITLDNKPKSFLLLTRDAIRRMKNYKAERVAGWRSLFAGVAVSFTLNIAASYVFYILFV